MSSVNCATHGLQRRTRVCSHIVETLIDRKPRGMFWNEEGDEMPCAWCASCDKLFEGAGEDWSDEVKMKIDEQVLCYACFKFAKQLNGFEAH